MVNIPMRNLGIIGCSSTGIANLHIDSYGDLFNLYMCCDLKIEEALKFQRKYKFEKSCSDSKDLINDKNIDVLVICTPPHVRKEIIIPAARAGKHILIEKPLAISMADAYEINKECKRSDVKAALAQTYRFFPHILEASRILKKRTLGKPFFGLLEDFLFGFFPLKSVKSSGYMGEMKQMLLIEMVVHYFDVLRALLGENAVEVYAKINRPEYRCKIGEKGETHATVCLTFESGCIVQVLVSWDCPEGGIGGPNNYKAHIECENGVLYINKDSHLLSVFNRVDNQWIIPQIKQPVPWETAWRNCMKDFLNAIQQDKEPTTSVDDNLNTMKIVFAAYRSVTENRPVRIDEIEQE